MIVLPESVRIVALTTPVTFQTDIDGLMRRVREELGADPFSGDLFCFFNPRRDRVKLLVWDRDGFWVLCKRLECGRFRRLEGSARRVDLTREELIALLDSPAARTNRFVRNFEREARRSTRADDSRSPSLADGCERAPGTAAR